MICSSCDSELPSGKQFCTNCGAPVNNGVSDSASVKVKSENIDNIFKKISKALDGGNSEEIYNTCNASLEEIDQLSDIPKESIPLYKIYIHYSLWFSIYKQLVNLYGHNQSLQDEIVERDSQRKGTIRLRKKHDKTTEQIDLWLERKDTAESHLIGYFVSLNDDVLNTSKSLEDTILLNIYKTRSYGSSLLVNIFSSMKYKNNYIYIFLCKIKGLIMLDDIIDKLSSELQIDGKKKALETYELIKSEFISYLNTESTMLKLLKENDRLGIYVKENRTKYISTLRNISKKVEPVLSYGYGSYNYVQRERVLVLLKIFMLCNGMAFRISTEKDDIYKDIVQVLGNHGLKEILDKYNDMKNQ